MAEKISGVIQYLNEKDGRWGKSYNVKIDGETYFLKGKYPPRGIAAGDTVELEYTLDGNYKKVEIGGMRKVDAAVAPPQEKVAKASTYKAASSFDDRQTIISKQASLNTALEFIKFAAEQGALPVPAKKNEGFGYLRAVWMQEAAALYQLNTGEVWDMPEADVEEEAPKPVRKAATKKAKPEPEVEDQDEDDTYEDDVNW